MANFLKQLLMFATLIAGLVLQPVLAQTASQTKKDVKQVCSTAGGSYSEGSNYARCEYSNGDSYTCNTDVNKCESCTGGKCTVSRPVAGGGFGPKAPTQISPGAGQQKSPTNPVPKSNTPSKTQ